MIGQRLLRLGAVSEGQLGAALVRQHRLGEDGQWKRLGEILIEMGAVSHAQVRSALDAEDAASKPMPPEGILFW